MKSIRKRLVGTLLGALMVLFLAGDSGIYLFTHALLLRDFDEMLRSAEPQVLAAVRNQLREHRADSGEISFRLSEALTASGICVEAWTPVGGLVGRSYSLAGADLPFPGRPALPVWREIKLSNLRRVRSLTLNLDPPAHELTDSGMASPASKESGAKEKASAELQSTGLPNSLVLSIVRDRTELDGTLQRLSRVLWASGLAMVLSTAIIVTFVSRRGLAPLEHVGKQASRIDASNLDFRFDVNDLPLELQSIGSRLNDLLSRLETAFARERCFSADVAHELRTPITELRSLAEIALKWPTSDAIATDAFRDTLDAALQMQRIVDGLLTISRCESGTQAIVVEAVAVASLVRRRWQPFESRAVEKGLTVQFDLSDDVAIETDGEILSLILTNLFSNAVEYAPEGGNIRVQFRNNGHFDFTVANSVKNLGAEDLTHFFERFWRKDAARSSSNHSGIGLSVSQACARVLGLKLAATMQADDWLVMRLIPA